MDYRELLKKYVHYIQSTAYKKEIRSLETCSKFMSKEEMDFMQTIADESQDICPSPRNGICNHRNKWLD